MDDNKRGVHECKRWEEPIQGLAKCFDRRYEELLGHKSYSTSMGQIQVDFPRFAGDDLRGWIYRSENFFERNGTPWDRKVAMAVGHLDGQALQWHQVYLLKRMTRETPRWEEYVQALHTRFGHTVFEDPRAELTTRRHTSELEGCLKTFDSWGRTHTFLRSAPRVTGVAQRAISNPSKCQKPTAALHMVTIYSPESVVDSKDEPELIMEEEALEGTTVHTKKEQMISEEVGDHQPTIEAIDYEDIEEQYESPDVRACTEDEKISSMTISKTENLSQILRMDSYEPEGNGSHNGLPHLPPIIPPDAVPERCVDETKLTEPETIPEPPKKEITQLHMARKGLVSKGHGVFLLSNHFKVNITNLDDQFFNCSVTITYEDGHPWDAKGVSRKVIDKVHKTYISKWDGKDLAYDGEKSLFTYYSLPRNKLEFIVVLEELASSQTNGIASSDEVIKRSAEDIGFGVNHANANGIVESKGAIDPDASGTQVLVWYLPPLQMPFDPGKTQSSAISHKRELRCPRKFFLEDKEILRGEELICGDRRGLIKRKSWSGPKGRAFQEEGKTDRQQKT